MNDSLESLLECAIRGATLAAHVTRRVQSEDTLVADAVEKAGNEPVTVADYASQALVLHTLRLHFPNVRIVSEEASSSLRANTGTRVLQRVRALVSDAIGEIVSESEVCDWIDHAGDPSSELAIALDPIDGTKGFLRREQYAIAVGILERGEAVGGVLVCPRLKSHDGEREGVVFTALRGAGAFERTLGENDPFRIKTSSTTRASEVRVLASVEASHGDPRLVDDLIQTLGLGEKVRIDSQVKYGVLARGGAEVYLRPRSTPSYRDHIWDHVAGVVIAAEAGARVTDIDGKVLDFSLGGRLENNRGVLATHGPMHDAIVAALARG